MILRPAARLTLPVLSLALALALSLSAASWPPQTDLPMDPAVTTGTLPNGLVYAVRPNTEPHDRVSLRLLVRAGSLDETEQERGLAHYLEHMAFNGTRDFPGDSVVEYLQRQGMGFGADTNASTGFDRTLYLLELAHNDPATVAEGLKVFRNYASGMLLDPQEINDERGIIFAEKRARDGVELRTWMAENAFILPDTLPPQRVPIGVDETLNAADHERLGGFYHRWYRPENMAVVIVGDIDPAATVAQIKEAFGSARQRRPPAGARGPRPHHAPPAAGRARAPRARGFDRDRRL